IAADAYAMETMTTITASLIDRGLEDYMLETAMLKVFTTERLWECINDAFQIYGGSAYFVDLPLERMLRDARINQIGEGSNEVLTSFIALVGMRGPGMEFKEIYDTMLKPSRAGIGRAWNAGMNRLGATVRIPDVPVRSTELRSFASRLGRLIWRFSLAVNRALITYREPILDMQLVQERIANSAMDLFASTCVLSRWDAEIRGVRRNGDSLPPNHGAADHFDVSADGWLLSARTTITRCWQQRAHFCSRSSCNRDIPWGVSTLGAPGVFYGEWVGAGEGASDA